MQTTQTIIVDLLKPRENVMHVVQEDSTRHIRLILLENNVPFNPAANLEGENLLTFVEFRKPDGHGGIYDTTSLGEPAVAIEDEHGNNPNIFTVALDGQCFTCPGWTQINIRFETEDGRRIHTFRIMIDVEASASSDTESTDWSDLESIAGLRSRVVELSGDVTDLSAQMETTLALRQTLTAGTDMDNVIQPGMYYKAKDVVLENMPDGQTAYRARILVFGANSDTAVCQLWVNVQANSLYVRTKNIESTAFVAWKKIATKNDIDDVQSALDSLDAVSLRTRTSLTANDDCDNLEIGSFFKDGLVTVANGVNANLAVIVSFRSASSSNYGKAQIWYDCKNGDLYFRSKLNTAFTEWKKIATSGEIDTLQSAINSLSNKSLVARTSLTANDNMNDVTTIGAYFKDRGVVCANGVDSTRARIIVLSSSVYGVVQLWFDTDNNRMYMRSMTSPPILWSNWERIATPATSKTILLSEGYINNSTGKWASSTGDLGRSVVYLKRIATNGACTCSVTWTPKNKKTVNGQEVYCDKLSLIEFDASGDFVRASVITPTDGTTSPIINDFTLSNSTKSITFKIYNSGDSAGVPNAKITLTLYGVESVDDIKLPSFGSNVANTRWFKFGYKAGTYVDDDGTIKPIYNTGMLRLPPNYDASGKPVPAIIYVHGSNAYLTKDGTQIAAYEPYYDYLNDCGYAIMDCYGWTLRYPEAAGKNNPFVMPTSCAAYESLLRLMLDSFNLDANNVFLLCKSQGGLMSSWISAELPIRAAAMLAPALNLNLGYTPESRAAVGADLGLVGVADTSVDPSWTTPEACYEDFLANYRSTWTAEKKRAFYQANEDKLMAWNAETKRVIGTTAPQLLEYAAKNQWGSSSPTRSLGRIGYAPVKIWIAQDDEESSYSNCAMVCQQIRNAGGEGVLRTMPSGTGGHHSVDTDENAPQQTNITTPLGYEYETVPLAYYEAWQWFEAHRNQQ